MLVRIDRVIVALSDQIEGCRRDATLARQSVRNPVHNVLTAVLTARLG